MAGYEEIKKIETIEGVGGIFLGMLWRVSGYNWLCISHSICVPNF